MRAFRLVTLALLALAALPPPGSAQVVGRVADRRTVAERLRGHATAGEGVDYNMDVGAGDTLLTSGGGALLVNFDDQTQLTLLGNSQVAIRDYENDPSGVLRTVFGLLEGKVHVFFRPLMGGTVTVVTPLGEAHVLHTEFVVAYDRAAERMQVVGVNGQVGVTATAHCRKGAVRVFPREMTTITRGSCPSEPQPLDDATYEQFVSGGEFIGGGHAEILPRDATPDPIPGGVLSSFKPRGPQTVFDRPSCTTPADCLKPPVVPGGGIDVQF